MRIIRRMELCGGDKECVTMRRSVWGEGDWASSEKQFTEMRSVSQFMPSESYFSWLAENIFGLTNIYFF